jgi:hypothetical protein
VTANTGDGILVDAGSINTLILGNFAVRNTDDGIDIDSPGATVTGNDADRNGDLGIGAVIGCSTAVRPRVGPSGPSGTLVRRPPPGCPARVAFSATVVRVEGAVPRELIISPGRGRRG